MKFFFLLCVILPFSLLSQNLVPNPSFESNRQLDKNSESITSEFKYVKNWNLLGWQSFYCHCKTNDPQNWYVSACRRHLYQPRTGCAMIKMVYEESSRTDTDLNSEIEYNGAASYLECKLDEPLELGSVYEISFWVFFPQDNYVEQSILTHIGFLPTLHYISMRPQSLLTIDRFFADSIPMGEWFQVKKYIRALCPLEYLVIGAFRNSTFPLIHRFVWSYPFYFIDDVNVHKVNLDTLSNTVIPTPYCNFFEEEEKLLEVPTEKNITLYFDTDSSHLSLVQLQKLDSFISEVDSRWQPVYGIIGHTDTTGDENEKLSMDRALNIRKILKGKHNIPEFRTVCFGSGSNRPISDNHSLSGRSRNRRVEIRITSLNKHSGLYRYCLEFVHNNEFVKAREYLKKWVTVTKFYEVIYVLFDKRFEKMHNTNEWKSIYEEIKSRYKKEYTSDHTFYLDSLRCEDQRYRTLELSILSNSGYFEEYESFPFESYSGNDQKIARADSLHLFALLAFLNKNDFPKISEIGRRNVRGIIYMLIHSGDTALMNHFLPIIDQRCLEGEAEWDTYAMMFDKKLVIQGLYQHYGTQSILNSDKTEMSLAPIDDLDMVNQRRVRIGLAPLNSSQLLEVQKVTTKLTKPLKTHN